MTLVVTGSALLGAAPAAHAAQLTVDDGTKADCPSAGFTTIQSAVDAAAAGDTISVCPGTYTEGPGGVGTNALTINKNLTLKGAGADLVTIQPSSANTPAGSVPQIADASAPGTPAIRNTTGDIVSIVNATVAISGVTVRSNDVYAESGVHFLNAQGGVANSRIGRIVTPSGAGAYGVSQRGQGVDALSTAGSGTFSVAITGNLIEGYNKGGIVVDSASDTSGTRSASRVQATITNNRIIGAGPQGNSGIGQNGIQVSAGAGATITGNLISDNRFNVSGQEGNGQGVLAFDAATGAGGTTITGNNIQNNSFGVTNADAAGNDNDTNPVPAQNNWWGNQNGPAVGSPMADRGDPVNTEASVPFRPFLTAPLALASAPTAQPDAAPTVQITAPADNASVNPGTATTITANAGDDIGVKQVQFFRGRTSLGTDTTAPYSATFTPAAGDAGSSQAITAIATDSRGQTSSDSISLRVAGGSTSADAPPTVSITSPRSAAFLSRSAPTTVSIAAADDKGVQAVTLLANGRTVCTDTTAPYSCDLRLTGSDVGQVTLIAVARDTSGQTTASATTVRVGRFSAKSLSASTTPKRDKRAPYRFRTSGRLSLPTGVSSAQGCGSGSVAVTYKGRGFSFTGLAGLSRSCTYSVRATVPRRGSVRVSARFLGNAVLGERSARSQVIRAG